MLFQTNIAETAEKVLLRYLAPERAKEAANEIAAESAGSLVASLQESVKRLFADTMVPAAPATAVTTPAPAKAKPKAKAKGPAARPQAGTRELSPEARKKMSFKKAVFHAKNRKKKGKPELHDAIILKASEEGKIISVEHAKRQAAAAARKANKEASVPPAAKPAATPAKKAVNGGGSTVSADAHL